MGRAGRILNAPTNEPELYVPIDPLRKLVGGTHAIDPALCNQG